MTIQCLNGSNRSADREAFPVGLSTRTGHVLGPSVRSLKGEELPRICGKMRRQARVPGTNLLVSISALWASGDPLAEVKGPGEV